MTSPLPPARAQIDRDEDARQQALAQMAVLDTPPEPEFDALVQAAARLCDAPMATIGLLDRDRSWFKAQIGTGAPVAVPRDDTFCSHVVFEGGGYLEVSDARRDPRFVDLPRVAGPSGLRFYAGAPLQLADGLRVGALCVYDYRPRALDAGQRAALQHLAQAAARALEQRRAAQAALQRQAEAQRAIEADRHRLSSILAATRAGTWEMNLCTRALRVDDRWAQMLGHTPETLGLHRIADLAAWVHPADWAPARRVFLQHVAADDAGFGIEMRMRHRDGHWVWVESRGQVQSRTAAGRPERVCGADLDISARKQQDEALRTSKRLLDRIGAAAGVGGWEMALGARTVYWSDQTCRLHGLPPGHRPTVEEAMGYFPPEARVRIRLAVRASLAGGGEWDLKLPLLRPDRRVLWVRLTGATHFGSGGLPTCIFGAFEDVTADMERELALRDAHTRLSRTSAELARQHELLRVTLRSISDAVVTTDAQAAVTWLNPMAERLLGCTLGDAQGRPLVQLCQLVSAQDQTPLPDPVVQCLQAQDVVALADALLRVPSSLHEMGIEASVAPIRSEAEAVLGTVLVFRDVTEQRRIAGEVSYRATHDMLTGLVNRAEFESRLDTLLRRAQADGSHNALLYIDLDQFKIVNDACGHAAGDTLLRLVGRLLNGVVRGRDTVARLGGDEFAILLEHCAPGQAEGVAQKICERMEAFRFQHEGRRFRIGASIGLVPVDARWPGLAAVMQAADSSCYAAKEAGRSRVHAWFDSDAAIQARHGEMQWAARIEQAFDDDGFVLYGQRIVAPQAPATRGLHAEILLRMKSEDDTVVGPGAFLPAAERFHLCSRIDRWVLRAVLDRLAGCSVDAIETLCVNLSGQSVGDPAFRRYAIEMLQQAGPAVCARLCLEITETAAITNLLDAAAFVRQVRELQVHTALDDFGAGASSFGYLKNLGVDVLKIDGQFITNVVEDALDEAAVRCFVDVARVVRVKTVAEFVDRPAVFDRVVELGVDYLQGFHLHRPEPLDALLVQAGCRRLAAAEATAELEG
ncbi:EAL domain-containing protein [uncultured Xylophilus sp.]|uniref:EAL domain-containing protein n=1 Tax=uncultured Xylophilus sp. TaxID=296832 RepID=UPI0025D84B92|nr:EAL domain-containing protein [uncultured Xylophilus sp.]